MKRLRVLLTKSFAIHYSLSLINTTLHNLSGSVFKYNYNKKNYRISSVLQYTDFTKAFFTFKM